MKSINIPEKIGLYIVRKNARQIDLVEVFMEHSTNKLYVYHDVIRYVDSYRLQEWKWYGPIELE